MDIYVCRCYVKRVVVENVIGLFKIQTHSPRFLIMLNNILNKCIDVCRGIIFILYMQFMPRSYEIAAEAYTWFGKLDTHTRHRVWNSLQHPITHFARETVTRISITTWTAAALAKFDDLPVPRYSNKDRSAYVASYTAMSERLLTGPNESIRRGDIQQLWDLYFATGEQCYVDRVNEIAALYLPLATEGDRSELRLVKLGARDTLEQLAREGVLTSKVPDAIQQDISSLMLN